MALTKVHYTDNETVIGAKNLNDIQDEIIANGNNINFLNTGKVDKVAGKGLSTLDFTVADRQAISNAYVKPTAGVPKTDLSQDVQTSLDKADNSLQAALDETLTVQGAAADAKATGEAIGDVKSALASNRTGTIELNPFGCYRYTTDGLSTIDIATMPLNTYAYMQYSVVKASLETANIPFSWNNTDYIVVFKRAAHRNTSATSIIELFNSYKKQHAIMIYVPSSDDKYRWILPSSSLTEQYAPADAKAVGDALALKQDISSLINDRTHLVLNPWGGIKQSDIGNSIDFRTFPINAFCFTTFQYIKQSLADTNMPDSDWDDDDYVVIIRKQISHLLTMQNSIIELYNFSKTRKLEMLYFAAASTNKYRWVSTGSGTVNYNTFENTINQYSNTYNVTASPSITTDTNNYLQPTGDQTDMSAAIETMLTQTGVCNLAPGKFYVSGIDMPDGSTLRGCGNATNIILLSSVTDGYAIKMGSICNVDSVQVSGGESNPTITSDIGGRNGIIWQGTAIPGESNASNSPQRGTITNCHIRYFSGSGIYCYGTGTNISNCLNVGNVYIYLSTVGINIAWLSEFHRFANVDCRGCYYGIINNGGNNTFANCGFSKNIIGLLMDNSNGQSYNNGHGTFTGCVFNHSGANNDGVAIQITGCTNGEVFDGCQIFYGEMVITNSEGIVFAHCNFGGTSTDITITNGGLVMYDGCCFKTAPNLTKTGNTATKFTNCYLRNGTAVTV